MPTRKKTKPARRRAASARPRPQAQLQRITTCLTYRDQAEEAVRLYTSVFRNAKVTSEVRHEAGPSKGQLLVATFEIDGQEFTALNGGPSFTFAQGISLVVNCTTQKELDHYWTKLSEGGEQQPCGWLRDRFGVSWQIVPVQLGRMLGDPERGNAAAVMDAMLRMSKLDIATLERAYKPR